MAQFNRYSYMLPVGMASACDFASLGGINNGPGLADSVPPSTYELAEFNGVRVRWWGGRDVGPVEEGLGRERAWEGRRCCTQSVSATQGQRHGWDGQAPAPDAGRKGSRELKFGPGAREYESSGVAVGRGMDSASAQGYGAACCGLLHVWYTGVAHAGPCAPLGANCFTTVYCTQLDRDNRSNWDIRKPALKPALSMTYSLVERPTPGVATP